MIPKATLLSLLGKALASGEITPDEVEQLLPRKRKQVKPTRRVSPEIRIRCRVLAAQHGLSKDDIRLRPHANKEDYSLHINLPGNKHLAGLVERFTGLHDLDDACERLVTAYLHRLDAES